MRIRQTYSLSIVLIAAPLLAACSGQAAAPDPFTDIPDACTVVSPQSIQDVVGEARGEKNITPIPGTTDTCQWSYQAAAKPEPSAQGVVPYRQGLAVQLYLHKSPEGMEGGSGVSIAQRSFVMMRNNQGMADKGTLEGIGDEAYGEFADGYGKLKFRTGNVTVEVRYEAAGVTPNDTTAGLGPDANRAALMKAANDVAKSLRK